MRVTLTDFVTYTKVEFNPGPNLNMVIGPNGTGKSTLVCAICIGLGWATKHLGRGKDLDEFVKHGAKQGLIEIELAADPQRHQTNPVIATRIKKGDKANAEYWIDGKKENKKRVHQLCASFSIQVDNLCQFLPQDRVVEFAGLSPVELLTQTQRAAAPQHMSDWHDQLKNWRKEQKEQQLEQQSLAESIKQLEDRHRQQEPDVQRFEERAGLQERSQALQKLRPLPEYNDAKKNYNHAKERRKEAVAELKDLERRTRPNRAAILHKQDYVEAIVNKALPAQGRMVEKVEASVKTAKKKIETAAERISECNDQIEAEKNSTKAVRQSMPQLQRNVSSLKKALETPPQPFDPAEMNEQIRQNTRQVRALNEQVEGASQEVGSIGQHIGQRERTIDEAESEKRHLDTQAGQQAQKLDGYSKDLARAWRWIQDNRGRFQGEVFGPPLVECKVKDERHAPAVESMLQPADALAFTVTTKADFDMLTDQIRSMKLRQTSVRASLKGLDTFRPPTTNEALRQYGLEGWLLDLLEGPEPVLAMLCDNRNMHQAAYTFRDISSSQFNALQQSPISSWVTAKQSHTITRRREYGDKATSTRVQDLRPARFWKDVTVDLQQQSAIDRRIAETKSEISELKQSRLAKMGEVKTIKAQVTDLEKEKQAIESEKRVKQSLHSQFNALPTKLEHAENKLNEAKKQIAGSTQRLRAIRDKHDALCLEKGQCALDYANAVESWRGQFVKLYEMEILGIEANSDLTQLKAQNEEEEQLIRATQQERDRLAAREAELLAVGKHLQQQCLEVGETLSPSEHELWAQLEDWSADQLNTELVSLDARLESLIGGGNANAKREYEDRAKEIEKKSVRFHRLQTALDTLDATIAEVREKWEPELDALVEEISGAFAENFSKIQCAGEVGVYKDEDFEQWAIQIKVKFRYVAHPGTVTLQLLTRSR